jgi:hypothetical protein
MTYSNKPNKHSELLANISEEDFDHLLREIDDLYGDASGLEVPPHFVARVTARAKAESVVAMDSRSLRHWQGWNWFWGFSLPVRVIAVSALLLASFGGIRAGLVITDLVTTGRKAESVAHTEMAPAEQSLVQLVRSEGLAVAGKSNQKSGEPQ